VVCFPVGFYKTPVSAPTLAEHSTQQHVGHIQLWQAAR